MNGTARGIAAAWIATAVLGASWAGAEAPARPGTPPAAAAKLADVAWMAGHWEDPDGANLSEEVWTAPSGDSMMGMWRLVLDGKVKVLELLSILEQDGGLVLRLRHFDAALSAREEKDAPISLPLTNRASGVATFEGSTSEGPIRITYEREGSDGLRCALEKNGKRDEFRFRRKRSGKR